MSHSFPIPILLMMHIFILPQRIVRFYSKGDAKWYTDKNVSCSMGQSSLLPFQQIVQFFEAK